MLPFLSKQNSSPSVLLCISVPLRIDREQNLPIKMFVSASAPDSPTLTSSSFITTTLSSASSLSIIRSCSMILDNLNHLIFASSPPSTSSLSPLYQHLNTTILSLLQKHLFSLNSALYQSPTPSLSSSALPFPSTSAENLLNEFHNEIVSVLTYFKRILNDLRKQRPNHFGIFEVSEANATLLSFHRQRSINTNV
jgi:hypothetical protein